MGWTILWGYSLMAVGSGLGIFNELRQKGYHPATITLVSVTFGVFWLPLWFLVVGVGVKIEIGKWRFQRREKGGNV